MQWVGGLLLILVLLPRSGGASQLDVRYIGRDEGLPSPRVHAVIETGDGFVWFAGPSGLARYDGWRVVTFGRDDGLSSHGLRSLAVDPYGRLWVGTEVGIDVREVDGRIHPLVAPDAWSYGIVDAMAAGPRRTMWIATARGLISWSEIEGLQPVTDPSLGERQVASVAVDANGRIWAVVPGVGLLRHGTSGWTRIEPPGLDELVGTVRTVTPSPRGVLLVGGDGGLAELDTSGSAVLSIGDATERGLVSAVIETGEELWLGRGGELHLLRRESRKWRPTATALKTGLINDLLVDRLGNLWAATDESGVAKVSALRHGAPPAEPPRVRLLEVAWSGAELDQTALPQTVVREGRWTLEAMVTAPWFIDEQSLTYRHRVRGFDRDWSPPAPGGAHRIRYTSLPAGSYTLEAQAHSPHVGWGSTAELMSFRVAAPWWRHPSALAAAFAIAVVAAAAVWRWRTRRLLERSLELERMVEQRTQELRYIAAHDELTGLPNQRAFWEQAHRHQALASRNGTDLSLAVLDLDDFKQVNDNHGHSTGDQVLADVAQRLLEVGRDSDFLARYGGEEFVVLMPETSETEALRAAERLRAALADTPFATPVGELTVTGSFGVSSLQAPTEGVEALFQRADSAVYFAKKTKNAVAAWERRSAEADPG